MGVSKPARTFSRSAGLAEGSGFRGRWSCGGVQPRQHRRRRRDS